MAGSRNNTWGLGGGLTNTHMKDFNPELNKDITRLTELHALKDKSQFNALKNEIMLKHGISKATVYREMKKDTPGLYNKPQYNPPQRAITEKEIAMVTELQLKKIPVMDLGRILEAETGDKYNWDRIDKIRSIIDARFKAEEVESGKPVSTNKERESMFGDEIKRICLEALKFDYMAPDAYIEFTAGEQNYRLCYDDIKDIVMICANAAALQNDGLYDHFTQVREKIWWLLTEKLRLINSGSGVTTKELLDIKNAFEEFEKSYLEAINKNYSVIWYVVHSLMPDADYSKVLELTRKYSDLYPECKIESCIIAKRGRPEPALPCAEN
jgi:hypothetical protein